MFDLWDFVVTLHPEPNTQHPEIIMNAAIPYESTLRFACDMLHGIQNRMNQIEEIEIAENMLLPLGECIGMLQVARSFLDCIEDLNPDEANMICVLDDRIETLTTLHQNLMDSLP